MQLNSKTKTFFSLRAKGKELTLTLKCSFFQLYVTLINKLHYYSLKLINKIKNIKVLTYKIKFFHVFLDFQDISFHN